MSTIFSAPTVDTEAVRLDEVRQQRLRALVDRPRTLAWSGSSAHRRHVPVALRNVAQAHPLQPVWRQVADWGPPRCVELRAHGLADQSARQPASADPGHSLESVSTFT